LSGTFRRASNPGGKEYLAYVLVRDWAEFDAAKVLPASINNQQNYGVYLYCRFARRPYEESARIYQSACRVLDKDPIGPCAEKARLPPNPEDDTLVTPPPGRVTPPPRGREAEDHSVPSPPGVIDVNKNQLVAMGVLATHDDDRRYLLFLIKVQHQAQLKRLN